MNLVAEIDAVAHSNPGPACECVYVFIHTHHTEGLKMDIFKENTHAHTQTRGTYCFFKYNSTDPNLV